MSPNRARSAVVACEPGAKTVLTQGGTVHPEIYGAPRDQPGGDHHGRVGCRRAARDRSDGDGAMAHLARYAVERSGEGRLRLAPGVCERPAKPLPQPGDRHTVVRARRAGERGFDPAQVDLDDSLVHDAVVCVEHALGGKVGSRELYLLRAPAEALELLERGVVSGEERGGGTIFRRHVGDRRALRHAEGLRARSGDLQEASDDAFLAQALGKGEGDVHTARPGAKRARQPHPHHGGHRHRDGLPERCRLCLDAADAPPEHAETVGGRGVRVSAHERVEVHERRAGVGGVRPCDAAEALDIQLMADAHARRHDLDVVEALGSPLEKGEPLGVALCLDPGVLLRGLGAAHHIGRDGMVDNERAGYERVHLRGILPALGGGVAHGREVAEHRDTGEVLKEHARRHEFDLGARPARKARLDNRLRAPARFIFARRAADDVL